jgi:ribosomal protein S18 acetylase RimI-like enzyme
MTTVHDVSIDSKEFMINHLTLERIDEAKQLVIREAGETVGRLFVHEAGRALTNPPETILCVESNRILGFFCITKSTIDCAMWGGSWLFVDPQFRCRGIGEMLIREGIRYVEAEYRRSGISDCLVEITTLIPNYYRKFGFTDVYHWGSGVQKNYLMIKELSLSAS